MGNVCVGYDYRVDLVERPRRAERADVAAATFCSRCWERIEHVNGAWQHVRAGTPCPTECRPLCDWPDCADVADPTQQLGKMEFNGHVMAWRTHHFLCSKHWEAYRKVRFVEEHT